MWLVRNQTEILIHVRTVAIIILHVYCNSTVTVYAYLLKIVKKYIKCHHYDNFFHWQWLSVPLLLHQKTLTIPQQLLLLIPQLYIVLTQQCQSWSNRAAVIAHVREVCKVPGCYNYDKSRYYNLESCDIRMHNYSHRLSPTNTHECTVITRAIILLYHIDAQITNICFGFKFITRVSIILTGFKSMLYFDHESDLIILNACGHWWGT